jgi:glutathione S-transferase
MALILYIHPLSSFCHKALFALFENGIEFTSETVNLGDPAASREYFKISPFGKIPTLRDGDQVWCETTILLEHVDRKHPGGVRLFPDNPQANLEARYWDRVVDAYLHVSMQKVVGDRLRPADKRDPFGVEEARAMMCKTYDQLEQRLEERDYLAGDALSIAGCAAMPTLFYSTAIEPFAKTHPKLAAYFERLYARPSYQRLAARRRGGSSRRRAALTAT